MQIQAIETSDPLDTQHGEIIRELIGREVGDPTERHSVAHVTIPPGKASLLHYHPEAEESYVILQGKASLVLADEEAILGPGEVILIPAPQPHKIKNIGATDLVFLTCCVPAWEPTNTVYLESYEGNNHE